VRLLQFLTVGLFTLTSILQPALADTTYTVNGVTITVTDEGLLTKQGKTVNIQNVIDEHIHEPKVQKAHYMASHDGFDALTNPDVRDIEVYIADESLGSKRYHVLHLTADQSISIAMPGYAGKTGRIKVTRDQLLAMVDSALPQAPGGEARDARDLAFGNTATIHQAALKAQTLAYAVGGESSDQPARKPEPVRVALIAKDIIPSLMQPEQSPKVQHAALTPSHSKANSLPAQKEASVIAFAVLQDKPVAGQDIKPLAMLIASNYDQVVNTNGAQQASGIQQTSSGEIILH